MNNYRTWLYLAAAWILVPFVLLARPSARQVLVVAPNTNIIIAVTNEYAYTNRTLAIDPPPTNYSWGATYLWQWSDGQTNLVPLGNFTFPSNSFNVPLVRQPCTNRYGAQFCVAQPDGSFQWSSLVSISFTCNGYELLAKTGNARFLSTHSLASGVWTTNSVPSPVIAGFTQDTFFRLVSGTAIVFCNESLPRYFDVVTLETNPPPMVASAVINPLPMPK